MKYQVMILQDAENDIFEIYHYILANDSLNNAEYVFKNIQVEIESLEKMPERGHVPPELERINIYSYKEVHFKPYRIIYEIEEKYVFIHCVFDGRREIQEILESRLLRY